MLSQASNAAFRRGAKTAARHSNRRDRLCSTPPRRLSRHPSWSPRGGQWAGTKLVAPGPGIWQQPASIRCGARPGWSRGRCMEGRPLVRLCCAQPATLSGPSRGGQDASAAQVVSGPAQRTTTMLPKHPARRARCSAAWRSAGWKGPGTLPHSTRCAPDTMLTAAFSRCGCWTC